MDRTDASIKLLLSRHETAPEVVAVLNKAIGTLIAVAEDSAETPEGMLCCNQLIRINDMINALT